MEVTLTLKWFRLYSEILNDPKVMLLSETMRWRYVAFLCVASEEKERGTLPHINSLAFKTRLNPLEVEETLKQFEVEELIEGYDEGKRWRISKWSERQFESDISTPRVQKHRKKQECNVSETPPDSDTDNRIQITDTEKKEEYRSSFFLFWEIYPKKTAKIEAEKKWMRIKPNEELSLKIIEAVKRYKKTDQWKAGYIPNPTTFLNQERWNDEIPKNDWDKIYDEIEEKKKNA